MGFGGGDFGGGGGGGFDNDFGSSYDSYSSSDSSHYSSGGSSGTSSGFERVLTALFCFSSFAIPVAIFMSAFLGASNGCSIPVYCSNGTSLNPSEQMWCVPPNVTTVTGRRQTGVKFYRIKEGKLPSLIERAVSVERDDTVNRNGYKYYSFFMNPGSMVNASLTSESGIDDVECYLIDSSNMDLFTAGKAFVAIFRGYKQCNISFTPKRSDTYYLSFGYRAKTGEKFAYVYFSMNFTYKVYDVSRLRPEGENNSKMVTFENVGTDEVIVADNSMLNESFVTLRLPDGIDLVPLLVCSIILFVCGTIILSTVILCLVSCCFIRKSGEKESVTEPLLDDGKTPLSSDDKKQCDTIEPTPTPSEPSVSTTYDPDNKQNPEYEPPPSYSL